MTQTYRVGSPSRFVTTVAWFFIVAASVAVLMALVRNATLGSLLAALPATRSLPSGLTVYLPWVMASGLALSLATLAAAVGLLVRLNWARRALIVLLFVAGVANLAGLWTQHELVEAVVDTTLKRAALPSAALDVFGGFVTASRILSAIISVALSAVLGWIALRLMSEDVRLEFA